MPLTAPLDFPEDIATWWLSHISKTLKNPDSAACLESLAPHVQALSDRFIGEEGARELGDYGHDEAMLLAYGAFFFPQTYARVQIPLAELCELQGWRPGESLRVLDWGAGLGAASLGALDWLRSEEAGLGVKECTVDAVEVAAESLSTYRKLTESLDWTGCTWRFRRGDMRQPTSVFDHSAGPWDLIIASFSLNEAFEAGKGGEDTEALAWLRWQLEHLAPGGMLLLLEPASQVASERLMAARDALVVGEEAHVWAPCLHQAACPMLGSRAWCHEVRRWPIPPHIEWINRRMHRAIEHLKFSFLALGAEAPPALPEAFHLDMRLVAPLSQVKGRWLTSGCTAKGDLWRLEIQKRQLDAAAKASYKKTNRGDLMRFTDVPDADAPTPHPHTGLIRLPKGASLQPLQPKDPHA